MGAKLDIDPDQVTKLASIGGTDGEIASFFGCSEGTVRGRFKDALKKGRDLMKISIKRKQFDVGVNKGNTVMLIWLGKQHLGQRDKHDVVSDTTVRHEHEPLSETAAWVGKMLGTTKPSKAKKPSTH